jgi:hypothetical protein
MMEYSDLRVLVAVARHGSMNRAAVELNMIGYSEIVRCFRVDSDNVIRLKGDKVTRLKN